jgi:hypothetical protein
MERPPKTPADAVHLLQLSELLISSARTVVDEWAKESCTSSETAGLPGDIAPHILPTPKLHEAQRRILAIAGSLTALASEPHSRIIEVACQYWESRALYLAAERRIPDMLAAAGDKGLSGSELGEKTGVEALKLCMFSPSLETPASHDRSLPITKECLYFPIARILRCLCSIHIFREVAPDQYANNAISASLVANEPLRAYVMLL